MKSVRNQSSSELSPLYRAIQVYVYFENFLFCVFIGDTLIIKRSILSAQRHPKPNFTDLCKCFQESKPHAYNFDYFLLNTGTQHKPFPIKLISKFRIKYTALNRVPFHQRNIFEHGLCHPLVGFSGFRLVLKLFTRNHTNVIIHVTSNVFSLRVFGV